MFDCVINLIPRDDVVLFCRFLSCFLFYFHGVSHGVLFCVSRLFLIHDSREIWHPSHHIRHRNLHRKKEAVIDKRPL